MIQDMMPALLSTIGLVLGAIAAVIIVQDPGRYALEFVALFVLAFCTNYLSDVTMIRAMDKRLDSWDDDD